MKKAIKVVTSISVSLFVERLQVYCVKVNNLKKEYFHDDIRDLKMVMHYTILKKMFISAIRYLYYNDQNELQKYYKRHKLLVQLNLSYERKVVTKLHKIINQYNEIYLRNK